MLPSYNPQEIEPRWQAEWENQHLYRSQETGEKPKFYCLDYFPYPSGEGLHVGHCRNYVPTDVISRYKRLRGFNVLHPMGWDAFGEPTEMYAVLHGVHPRVSTDRNTANYKRQLLSIGTSYDWEREIDSSDSNYYRWTQWFFLLLYRKDLAYRDENWQWWCPTCQTTLSSHEAAGGVCWRGHQGVERRKIPAWYFRITAYADRLLEGLDRIDWLENIKTIQRNWIGRSEGVEVAFPLGRASGIDDSLIVFTTRPDTIFGVTFLVMAPEHPLVDKLTTGDKRVEVEAYKAAAARRGELDRMSNTLEVTGVFSGSYVINPANDEKIPVWIADYVLMNYGTGAVMGVPAHDGRDFAFARMFNLPIRVVISQDGNQSDEIIAAYEGSGTLVHSAGYNGMDSTAGGERICDWLENNQSGIRKVQYRMRDWLISRQRYWGTPIPIVYCEHCGSVPVPEDQLPILLPEMKDFRPDGSGRSPLARVPEFVHTTCPHCGGPAERETDTMGGFACSSWYFLRFTSPDTHNAPFKDDAVRYWMPVDLYVGGAEHAVLHLLYSRFWTKVMYDAGLVAFDEPFASLRNQGQLLGVDGQRMSKSRGNVVTPDEVVRNYGADALRLFGMFIAPFDQDIAWSTTGIQGTRRFLNKVWKLYQNGVLNEPGFKDKDPDLERQLHKTIRQVEERIENLRFNTMVSALMEFVNTLEERRRSDAWKTASYQHCLETLLILMAPAAPHIAEELWHLTGHPGSVHQQNWPTWDADLAKEDLVEIVVQVDGRVRDVITIGLEETESGVRSAALASLKVKAHLKGRDVAREVYIPGRVFNLITEPGK